MITQKKKHGATKMMLTDRRKSIKISEVVQNVLEPLLMRMLVRL